MYLSECYVGRNRVNFYFDWYLNEAIDKKKQAVGHSVQAGYILSCSIDIYEEKMMLIRYISKGHIIIVYFLDEVGNRGM